MNKSVAKERVNQANVNIAKKAIRDKSPSYLNNKLVSQTSLDDPALREELQSELSTFQKDAIKAEVNEHVLQNALKKRSEWRVEHKLDDKQLFVLFSEFSSMMQITREQANDNAPNSMKNKLLKKSKHAGEFNEAMNKLFPICS